MDEKKKQGTLNCDTKNENWGHKKVEVRAGVGGAGAAAMLHDRASLDVAGSGRSLAD